MTIPKDRRAPSDHEVVMTVIHSMRVVAYMLYGSLALCLVVAMGVALRTGDWGIPILGILVTAVATGGGNATGFIGGVLSTTGTKQTPQPVTVENTPEDAAPVEEAK